METKNPSALTKDGAELWDIHRLWIVNEAK